MSDYRKLKIIHVEHLGIMTNERAFIRAFFEFMSTFIEFNRHHWMKM